MSPRSVSQRPGVNPFVARLHRFWVLAQRDDLLDDLTPTLRRQVQDELPELYARARKRAMTSLRKHGEGGAAERLPETCPYTLEQITGDWLP